MSQLNTILRLQSVPSGSALKPSSSLLITHSCLFTVMWLYAMQLIQAPSALQNVHQMAEEDVKWAIRWLMMCTLWPRAHCTWHVRSERKRVTVLWTRVVSEYNGSFTLLYFIADLSQLIPSKSLNHHRINSSSFHLGSSSALMTTLFVMCVACLAGTALMAFKKSRDKPVVYTALATGDQEWKQTHWQQLDLTQL